MIATGPKGIIARLMHIIVSIIGCLLLFLNSFFTMRKESNAYKKEEID